MVKIKVCGITNIDDAIRAVELGADLLGFNFYPPSPRYIAPEKARAILAQVPPEIGKVALFVNEPAAKIRDVIGQQAFSGLQFHGDESATYCRGWELKVIKAFRVRDRESLGAIDGFPADYYLVDSWAPGYGGSGAPFPWSWLEGLRPDRLILAGGLDAGNVAEAIRLVRPYGVDVCTGVEARPGIKDHEKLKAFIAAAKSA
ncbi:MAG TPA: phosphoribosylanthranilate isomerase [Candidatus Binatia bacterium]|jgi:phosphoribosylanthranilate isomerase